METPLKSLQSPEEKAAEELANLNELLLSPRQVTLKNRSFHTFASATLKELARLERESVSRQKIAKDGARRAETNSIAAIRNFYDSLVMFIGGYEELAEPVSCADQDRFKEVLDLIPIQDKLEAIQLLYPGQAWVSEQRASLTNPRAVVTLEFGSTGNERRVSFELRKPSESDLRAYTKAFQRTFRSGQHEDTASVSVDVTQVVGLFDAMYLKPAHCPDLGTVTRDLDPTWKRMIVDALFAGEQDELQD